MSLIKGRMRLFCVSNIIVSFACTGFLGPRYYNDSFEVGQSGNNMDLTADEVIPLSQLGEGEKNIIEELAVLPDVNNIVKEVKAKQTQKAKVNTQKVVKNNTVTKAVVAKKEVASSVKYTPAVYSEVTGNAVIEYAKKYMGLRYVSAGNSLSTGTDCSGFTRLIYKEFGVSLPRTVSGQISKGTYVKKSDLQKGDLVFYSGGGRYATHVGMYMGNGLVIHESNPRDGVKISSVNMMHYITARRVINSTAKKIAEQKLEEKKSEENKLVSDTTKEVKDSNTSTSTNNTNNTNISTSTNTNANTNTSLNNVNKANTESISETKEIQNTETVKKDTSTNTSAETDESKLIMDSKKGDSSVTNIKEEVKETVTEQKKETVEEKKEETKIEVTKKSNVEETKKETVTTKEVSKEEVKQEVKPTETKESLENTEK